ncbi:Unknown protein, partial [Striga hermonthica]
RITAAAAAQAVQQVTSHTSHATTAPATVARNQDEDVSSYGEGGVGRDRAMERMAEQLRQLQDKLEGRPERRAQGHPFSREILVAPLPNNFKETNLVYDGSSDPSRHVRTFENMAVQGEKESLRKYVARYNQTCLEVHSTSDEVKVGALIRSLRAGPCRTSLATTPARSYEEVLKRCRKYINLEEMEVEFAKLEGSARPKLKKEQSPPRGRSPRRSSPKRSGSKKISPRWEGRDSKRGKRDDRWQGRPLLFERQKNYRHLKDEIERLIRAGHLKEFVYHDRAKGKGRRRCQDDSEERSDRDEEGYDGEGQGGRGKRPRRDGDKGGQGGEALMKRGTIYMLSGGPTNGDSNRARKEHARAVKRKREKVGITARIPVISFKAEVASFDVKRVFIDTGSSVDVMFYDCFMQINKELNMELKLLTTSHYGFNGGEVMSMGEISLPVALGAGDLRKVRMVRFVVVGAESSYNIIMGRTSLNAFQAVVSTYHLTIKYPVGENVGEIVGDQLTSRSCYQTTVSNNKQLARRQAKSK